MQRSFTSAFTVAAMLAGFVVVDVASAQRPRNPIERRFQPNKGFWENSTPSRQQSVSRGTSWLQNSSRYIVPQSAFPQSYVTPQTYGSSQSFSQRQTTVSPRSYVTPGTRAVPPTYVVVPNCAAPSARVAPQNYVAPWGTASAVPNASTAPVVVTRPNPTSPTTLNPERPIRNSVPTATSPNESSAEVGQ